MDTLNTLVHVHRDDLSPGEHMDAFDIPEIGYTARYLDGGTHQFPQFRRSAGDIVGYAATGIGQRTTLLDEGDIRVWIRKCDLAKLCSDLFVTTVDSTSHPLYVSSTPRSANSHAIHAGLITIE